MIKNKRACRSDIYQYKFWETNYDHCKHSFVFEKSLYGDGEEHSTEFIQLNNELISRVYQLAVEKLTELQLKIAQALADGMNTTEAAKELETTQSSIWKSMRGNTSYKGNQHYHYGGTERKMQLAILADPQVQQLMMKIYQLTKEE